MILHEEEISPLAASTDSRPWPLVEAVGVVGLHTGPLEPLLSAHMAGRHVCCSMLQCVAVCCSVLQCGLRSPCCRRIWQVDTCVAVCCSVLQCVAVCCNLISGAVVVGVNVRGTILEPQLVTICNI